MDNERFEWVSRVVGGARNRREALAALVGIGLAAFPGLAAADVDGQSQLIKGCRIPGQRCRKDKNCCGSIRCRDKRCTCKNKNASCLVELAPEVMIPIPALCCSNKCSKRSGKCG